MKVRALVSFASPVASPARGDVIDVSEAQATAWLEAGLVEPILTRSLGEAVRSAPEQAVTRKARR